MASKGFERILRIRAVREITGMEFFPASWFVRVTQYPYMLKALYEEHSGYYELLDVASRRGNR